MRSSIDAFRGAVADHATIDVNIDNETTAVARVRERLSAGRGFCFFTMNLDHLRMLRSNPAFAAAYRAADFVSADGWPIVWLARRRGAYVERTTGADLIDPICAASAAMGVDVYVVGPGESSRREAIAILSRRHAGLRIAGSESPMLPEWPDEQSVAALAGRIRESGARMCLLSLGSPKQELLAARLHRLCPDIGFIGVGAGLDFISGRARRSPALMHRNRLEWLWRILCEPRRLGPRYLRCGTFFAGLLWDSLFYRAASLDAGRGKAD
jgi:exopolysaccharide biosynthesis WecB/TagA/CpsF family protein